MVRPRRPISIGRFAIGQNAFVAITNINALGDSQTANTVKNDGILHFNFDESGLFAKPIDGDGGISKSGASILTLSGNLTYEGNTVVSGGSLIADLRNGNNLFLANDGTAFQIRSRNLELDILDGKGQVLFDGNGYSLSVERSYFADGEMRNLDQLTVGQFLTVGDVQAKNIVLRNGATLTLTPNHFITLENGASFGEDSVFGVSINDSGLPLVKIGDTAQWSVHPTATLDIQGYRQQPTVLFETSGDAFANSDLFQLITVAGQAISETLTEDQFIDAMNVTINPDNQNQIIATSGFLVWYNGVTPGTENYDAHGTFKVDSFFWLDEQLNNNESGMGAVFGWDGKTLKKTGAGRLVLTAANTYTGGTRIENGIIAMMNADAVGTGEIVINAGAGLDVAYAGVLANNFSGSGTLNLQNDIVVASGNPGFAGQVNIANGVTTAAQIHSLGNNITTTLEENTLLLYNVNESGSVANSIDGNGAIH